MVRSSRLVLLVCLLFSPVMGQDQGMSAEEGFNFKHQAGIRLGAWASQGDNPSANVSDSANQFLYQANIKNTNFYFEAYFGYRLSRPLMLEVAGGIVNRGDVNISDSGFNYIGNLMVYPISVRLKLYPFGGGAHKYQPYIMGGGALYYGRFSIQFSNDLYAGYSGASATRVGLLAGAGIDYPLASQVGLDVNMSYMPINFSGGLLGAKNYNAFTVTVGVKYLYSSHKQAGHTLRRSK